MAEKDRKARNDMRIKFDDDHHSILTQIGNATGAPFTAIVRLALDDFLPKYAEKLVQGKILSEMPLELSKRKTEDPQARVREGRARKKAGVVALAAFGALTLMAAPAARADSKVSTSVASAAAYSVYQKRRRKLHLVA